MLGAVVFGHEQMQVAIKAINELKAEAGKPAWNWAAAGRQRARSKPRSPRTRESRAVRRLQDHRQAGSAAIAFRRSRKRRCRRWPAAKRRSSTPATCRKEFANLEYRIVRGRIIAGEPRIDGRDMKTVRPIYDPHRRAAAYARLGAVHSRRDAGAGRDDARHRPRRADHRCARPASAKSRSCSTTTSRRSASARPA